MKTVIVFKVCMNPKDAMIRPDGTADWGMASLAASDDDFRATEIAKTLGGEVIGLTIGTGDAAWAAARGADSTVVITDAMPSSDAAVTADILAKAVMKIGDVDLVMIGDSSWDPAVPVLLGAKLGWNTLAGVTDAAVSEFGYCAKRRLSGSEQNIEVSGPAVMAIAAKAAEETPPGLKQVLMARKKPVTKMRMEDLGMNSNYEENVVRIGEESPENTEAEMICMESPEETVKILFDKLHEEGVL